jgi:hypothetical protein
MELYLAKLEEQYLEGLITLDEWTTALQTQTVSLGRSMARLQEETDLATAREAERKAKLACKKSTQMVDFIQKIATYNYAQLVDLREKTPDEWERTTLRVAMTCRLNSR